MTFQKEWFIASLLGYPVFDKLFSSILFTNLPESRAKIYRNRLLSTLHSLWTSSLCLYLSLKNIPDDGECLRFKTLNPPLLLHKVISAEIGYLIQDSISVWMERKKGVPWDSAVDTVLLHHSVLSFLFSLYERDCTLTNKPRTEYYMACLFMMGASNILMHSGWLVERLWPKSLLFTLLRATTWPAFMFFRFMVFVWVFYVFAKSKGSFGWLEAPLNLRPECLAGSVSFIAFNGWLGWVLFVKSYKKRKWT